MDKDRLLELFKGERLTYTIMPRCVIMSKKLTPFQKVFYAWLLSNAKDFHPSLRFIAETLNVSLKTVFDARKALQEVGLIKIIPRGRQKACIYAFNPPLYWNL